MKKLNKVLEVRTGEKEGLKIKSIKESSGMKKLEKALELRKAKYLKRTGSPGSYKYIYSLPGGKVKVTGKGQKRAGTARPDFGKKIVIPKGLKQNYDYLTKPQQIDIDRAIRAGWKPNVKKLYEEAWGVLATMITDDHDAYLEDWIDSTSKEDIEEFEEMGMTPEEAYDEMTAGDIMSDLYPEKIPPDEIMEEIFTGAADDYMDEKKKTSVAKPKKKKK